MQVLLALIGRRVITVTSPGQTGTATLRLGGGQKRRNLRTACAVPGLRRLLPPQSRPVSSRKSRNLGGLANARSASVGQGRFGRKDTGPGDGAFVRAASGCRTSRARRSGRARKESHCVHVGVLDVRATRPLRQARDWRCAAAYLSAVTEEREAVRISAKGM